MPEVTRTALRRIERGFESPDHYASLAVSRFMEEDISVDASERVNAFLSDVNQHFREL
jgi:hypothetical protein